MSSNELNQEALDKACTAYANLRVNNGDIIVEYLVEQTILKYLSSLSTSSNGGVFETSTWHQGIRA